MRLSPSQFLAAKLAELQTDSARELPKATAAPAHTAARLYSRIKMTCGVIDTLEAMGLHHLTPTQQTAYQAFRQHSWEALENLDTNPAPIAVQLYTLIETFHNLMKKE